MFAAGDRSEEFKFDFLLNIVVTKLRCAELDRIPIHAVVLRLLDFRLVDGCPLLRVDQSVDNEEIQVIGFR